LKEAPLFAQALNLSQWLLTNLAGPSPLTPRIHAHALDLLERIVLALKGFDRDDQIDQADRAATLLRVHLRLALELGQLDDQRYLFLAGELDGIGRQIGGWQRRQSSSTIPARHR
jgi:hypothetical protein